MNIPSNTSPPRTRNGSKKTGRSKTGRSRVPASPVVPDPTREIAYDIVRGVIENRRMLETTLGRSQEAREAEPRDRAAAHRLGAATLRHLGTLSTVLEPFLRKQPPEPVRIALLIGTCQLLFLETPPHAAVGTTVNLLRRRELAPFADWRTPFCVRSRRRERRY